MSQRLVNVVCMIFTLVAAASLYVFMHEYSMSGSDGAQVAEWNRGIAEPNRVDVNPESDARPTESLEDMSQPNQAEPPSRPLDLD